MKREVLFSDTYIRVVKLDDWFLATESPRSMNDINVAVLPWRKNKKSTQFLSRFELNPAHMTNKNPQVSIITGACETEDPLYHAQQELLEEAGYDINKSRFNFHGEVSPMKSTCTKIHLYSVRIISKDKRQEYHGDGSSHEHREYADWTNRNNMIWAKDPYIHTIMMRAGL